MFCSPSLILFWLLKIYGWITTFFQYHVDITFDYGFNFIEKRMQYNHEFSIEVILMEIKRDYYLNKLIAQKHNIEIAFDS